MSRLAARQAERDLRVPSPLSGTEISRQGQPFACIELRASTRLLRSAIGQERQSQNDQGATRESLNPVGHSCRRMPHAALGAKAIEDQDRTFNYDRSHTED